MDRLLLQFEHLGQILQRNGIVNGRIREEVSAQTLLLNPSNNHGFDFFIVMEQIPHLNKKNRYEKLVFPRNTRLYLRIHLVIDDEIAARLPIAV